LLPNSGDIVGCNVYDEAVLPIGVTEGSYTNLVTYTGRKDFPLTPKDEPCWRNTGTDYATFSPYTIVAEEIYEIEYLQLNYTNASTSAILGNQFNDNFILGFNSDNWAFRWGDAYISVSTGLDLSVISDFVAKFSITNIQGTGNNITAVDISVTITDLGGNVLYTGSSLAVAVSGTVLNMMFASKTSAPTRFTTGDIPWIKFYVDDVLTNHWEYLGKNSLIIWDRTANKNHATITTNNITLNQGTQDVYSSRLKDGYSDGSGAYLGEFIPANSYIEKLTETPNSDVLFKGGSNLNFGTTQTINIWYKLTPNSQNQSYLLYEGPNRYTLFISANTLYFQPHQDGGS